MGDRKFTRGNIDETVDLVYRYIAEYIDENGYPPSVRDICQGVGIHSTSTIHGHLKRLNDSGRIEYAAGKRRAITIPARQAVQVINMPVVGTVAAGVPLLAEQNIERVLPFPADFIGKTEDSFALKVRGDSMIDAAILDGDYVLVRRQQDADSGDIVVALLEDEATVKTLVKEKGRIYLQPENAAYRPIPFEGDQCRILGKVVGIFRVCT
ncbi:MAG: transcriptional repressor LexA [Clostridia bacterium]|nr:transcriptional repressor LexA [Clostridia bacterium]